MAGDTNAELPVWGYEVENFINLGTSEAPEWTEFDNLLSWDQSTDTNSYEPSYINRKNSPKFTLSKDFNVEYEVDLYKNNKLSTYLVEHEDEEDIPVEVVRVYNWLGEDGKRTAKMLILGIFAGRIDDEIAVADILGLMIMNGFAAQRLNERTLSGFTAADQDQFFHVYVLVIAQTLKPSARSAYSVTAARLASTSSTFPVTMSVPLNRSTKPSSAADFLIARSAAMIAYSAGVMVTMPIALLA